MNEKNILLKTSMNYGAIVGLVMVIASFVFYSIGILFSSSFQFLNYFIIIGGVYYSCRKYRDEILEGTISYGKALIYGTLVIFFSSIIYGFYTYLLYQLDPEMISNYLNIIKQALQERNMGQEQYDTMINFYSMIISPLFLAFSEILGKTIQGFLFSLIISYFIKRNDNMLNIKQNQ